MYPTFDGKVQARFQASDQEILQDLMAVLEAVQLKPVRLTKSGIPPKPLWGALNQRLVWRDPTSILHDWEEVDQVRFVYRIASNLDLVRPDSEGWLQIGPGADQFFLSSPVERAAMLRLAHHAIEDWDERCDARDEEGHRYNFGQAYRRDFVHDIFDLRDAAWSCVNLVPEGWVETTFLAKKLSDEIPDLLLSEVCEPAPLDDNGVDPEILRFVNYWLTLYARFGWADIARAPGDDANQRLCRLTPLGLQLIHGKSWTETDEKPVAIDQSLLLTIAADGGQVTDRYVASRLGAKLKTKDDEVLGLFQLSHDSLTAAAQSGADLESQIAWLAARTESPLPERLKALVGQVQAGCGQVRIIQNVVAVELDPNATEQSKGLQGEGFLLSDTLAVAAGRRVPSLLATAGGDPAEGFRYPTEEPLAVWKAGTTLRLEYSALPLQQRMLLLRLGVEGDPLSVTLTAELLAELKGEGWTADSLSFALTSLTQKKLPGKLKDLFNETWEA